MTKEKNPEHPFKERYTIQDLENLSGIKSHTIRIWEQRYSLLHPSREGNNIRYYSHRDLQKLLNVSVLYHHGYKISRIASFTDTALLDTVRQETLHDTTGDFARHSLKMSMLTFDVSLFHQTLQQLLGQQTFREVFTNSFLPLLLETGYMWQTETITVAQEHFLSNLLRQTILTQVSLLYGIPASVNKKVFVLFLPAGEVHELGLLYSYYELCLKGHRTVYLGQSVPFDSLQDLQQHFPGIIYITAFTIYPPSQDVVKYLKEVSSHLLRKGKDEMWVSGRKIQDPDTRISLPGVLYILEPEDFLQKL